MKFLNKKERVIDIKLTQYGKHLLSKGDFRPSHYAFFDDDVIYDRKYAAPNKNDGTGKRDGNSWATEPQNEIEDRIKEDLRLETQYVFSGIETDITKVVQAHSTNRPNDMIPSLFPDQQLPPDVTKIDPFVQSTPAKIHGADSALGRSDLGINKKSAFNIDVLQGRILTSKHYKTDSGGKVTNIPQLEMAPVTYKSQVQKGDPQENPVADSYTTEVFNDGNYLRIFEDCIVLEIDEMNTPFENENFDIEVFEIDDNSTNTAGTTEENLIPLYFMKQREEIKDNILLDEPENTTPQQLTPNCVEYYFNVKVDHEIGQETLCRLKPADKAQGIFSSRMLSCDDLEQQQKISNRDYYKSDVTEEDLEDC
tara:strand:- start:934 stop:2031 length:1098 start_codon:yes stop_codon:yes gene_type:complete